jgi:hypothetical protein
MTLEKLTVAYAVYLFSKITFWNRVMCALIKVYQTSIRRVSVVYVRLSRISSLNLLFRFDIWCWWPILKVVINPISGQSVSRDLKIFVWLFHRKSKTLGTVIILYIDFVKLWHSFRSLFWISVFENLGSRVLKLKLVTGPENEGPLMECERKINVRSR